MNSVFIKELMIERITKPPSHIKGISGLRETKTCKTHKTLFVIESRNRSILHNLQSPATEENYGLKKT